LLHFIKQGLVTNTGNLNCEVDDETKHWIVEVVTE